MAAEEEKVLVFEIAIPGMNVEEIAKADPGDVPLQFILGHASNQVAVVWQATPVDEEDFELGAYQGYVVRAHLADAEWVRLASDKFQKPVPESEVDDEEGEE